jgi:succinylglutamate desuccinylase
VIHRHAIQPGDDFRMEPAFANIQRVARGTLLARDARGDVRAPATGLVLMPLYQAQGDDGFFFGREVPAWRTRLAAAVRGLSLERALPLLPGVRRAADPHDRPHDRLDVSPRAASFYPRELFNMLGFRRVRPRGTRWLVSRVRQK